MLCENQPGQIQLYVKERNDMLAGRRFGQRFSRVFIKKKEKGEEKICVLLILFYS